MKRKTGEAGGKAEENLEAEVKHVGQALIPIQGQNSSEVAFVEESKKRPEGRLPPKSPDGKQVPSWLQVATSLKTQERIVGNDLLEKPWSTRKDWAEDSEKGSSPMQKWKVFQLS